MTKKMIVAHNFEDRERTEDVIINEDVSFERLMLSETCLQGLNQSGFKKPSPIQLRAIPLGKCGFDLIVEAKSGTGKTAVFGIVALEMLQMDCGLQAIILAPTREIATQIGHVITAIGSFKEGLKLEVVIGGTSVTEDVKRLQENKFHILVGSPGRVKHLIKKNYISTDSVRLFVLDEADKLMEDVFQPDINYIFSQLPQRKQVIAASATYTPELREFLGRYMRSTSHIRPNKSNILLGLSQYISIVPLHLNAVRQSKIMSEELLKIISNVRFKQSLVFCNYQTKAKAICNLLRQNGWPTEFLASSQTQSERLQSLQKLQSFSCRVLVATDLAARGIDATNVDLVINLELPYDLSTYLHRIGRAGRYGSKGISITILSAGKEELAFQNILDGLGDPLLLKPFQLGVTENISTDETKPAIKEVQSCGHSSNLIQKISSLMTTLPNSTLNLESFNDIAESFCIFEKKNQSKACDSFDSLLDSLSAFSSEEHPQHTDVSKSNNLLEYINQIIPKLDKVNESFSEDKKQKQSSFSVCTMPVIESKNQQEKKVIKKQICFKESITNKKKTVLSSIDCEKSPNNPEMYESGENVKTKTIDASVPSKKNYSKKRIIKTVSKDTRMPHKKLQNSVYTSGTPFNNYESYLSWRMQLSCITQQIQQSVYLKTIHDLN